MITKLVFNPKLVLNLIKQTQNAENHLPALMHLKTPYFWDEAVEAHPIMGCALPEQINISKIEPHLRLIQDEGGIRLESSGKGISDCVYAKGFTPDINFLEMLASVDLGKEQIINLKTAKRALSNNPSNLMIHLSAKNISIHFENKSEIVFNP